MDMSSFWFYPPQESSAMRKLWPCYGARCSSWLRPSPTPRDSSLPLAASLETVIGRKDRNRRKRRQRQSDWLIQRQTLLFKHSWQDYLEGWLPTCSLCLPGKQKHNRTEKMMVIDHFLSRQEGSSRKICFKDPQKFQQDPNNRGWWNFPNNEAGGIEDLATCCDLLEDYNIYSVMAEILGFWWAVISDSSGAPVCKMYTQVRTSGSAGSDSSRYWDYTSPGNLWRSHERMGHILNHCWLISTLAAWWNVPEEQHSCW